MAKMIAFDQEARDAMRRGVGKLARAVRSTLGPRGRNAVLDKGWGSPKVTKDGVIKQWTKPVTQEQVRVAVRECRSGENLHLRRNGWCRAMGAQGHGSYSYQRRLFNAP